MAIHYRDPKTGEYEVIKIPVMKGDQGHAGIHVGADVPPTTDIKLWFDPSDTDNDVDLANRLETTLTACYDYMGNDRGSIKDAADANVEYILGEVNTHHYEGQRITATDTIERQVKQAELKGQTLVNGLSNPVRRGCTEAISLVSPTHILINLGDNPEKKRAMVTYKWLGGKIEDGKDYTLDIWILKNTMRRTTDAKASIGKIIFNNHGRGPYFIPSDTLGHITYEVTTSAENTGGEPYVETFAECVGELEIQMMIRQGRNLEPIENHFEGMKSVQMPVLTTVGKNLFNKYDVEYGLVLNISTGELKSGHSGFSTSGFIKVSPNTTYIRQGDSCSEVVEYTHSKIFSQKLTWNNNKITTSSNASYVRFVYQDVKIDGVQLEQGSVKTSYEPYKSNILSIDGEYRGIGDACDTVDLITGEKVERIGEITFDGSEGWRKNDIYSGTTGSRFVLKINDIKKIVFGKLLCDKMRVDSNPIGSWKTEGEYISADESNIAHINIRKAKDMSLVEFTQWLAKNPITIQYELAEPVVKTVDLKGQKVYSYDGTTHYTCSAAEGSLVPTLSIDVPTNLPALVSRQRQQIEILEKENQVLSNELELAITSSEQNDGELLAQSFELDFRMMEVESALNLPMAATFQLGGKAMAMTPYDMAKKLILASNYERSDMERKLDVYVSKKRMTEVERQELIQLMNEAEGVITVEPEAEEFVTEHEAVTIPLH